MRHPVAALALAIAAVAGAAASSGFAQQVPPETPKLEVTPFVRVDRVEHLFEETEVTVSSFVVRAAHAKETTKVAFGMDIGASGPAPVLGSVRLDPDAIDVPADKETWIEALRLKVSDGPTGTTDYFMVAGAQTLAPAKLKLSVVRRFDEWYLLLCLLVGLVVGTALRIWLPQIIARNTFLARLRRLDVAIVDAKARRGDAAFRAEMDRLAKQVAELRTSKDGDDAARTTKAVGFEAAFDAALAASDQRNAAAGDRIDGIRRLVDAGWLVPKAVREALTRSSEELSAAGEQVVRGELDQGTEAADAAVQGLANATPAAATAWWQSVVSGFDRARGTAGRVPGLSQEEIAALAALATALSPAAPVAARQPPAPDATAEQRLAWLRPALAAIDNAARTADAAWGELRQLALRHLEATADPAAVELQTRIESFRIAGELAQDAPDLSKLANDVAAALALAPAAALLGGGRAPGTLSVSGGPQTAAFVASIRPVARGRMLDEVRAYENTAKMALFLQNAAAWVLVLFIGWSVFSPTWIGTQADVVKVVFWGFTADMGLAALVSKATSLAGR